MQKAVVVGAGFLGGAIAKMLEAHAWDVVLCTPHPTNIDQQRLRLPLDEGRLSELTHGAEIIVHAIREGTPTDSEPGIDPLAAARTVTKVAEANGARPTYLSSAAVYGNVDFAIETSPIVPVSDYGRRKADIERIFLSANDTLILRISNPYGPGQGYKGPQGLLGLARQKWQDGNPIRIRGDGGAVRDWIHVEDVVTAVVASTTWPAGVYNVSTGKGTSVKDALSELRSAMQVEGDLVCDATDVAEIQRSVLDPSKAASEGWKASFDLPSGIRYWLTEEPTNL